MTTTQNPEPRKQSIHNTMITRADVVTKFKELHNKYHRQRGYMISTVPDETSGKFHASSSDRSFVWNETYNRYASETKNIRSCNVCVPLMGRMFNVRLDAPLVQDHRHEFESYFGFGGHCEGYTQTRIIACYPVKFDDAIDIDELLVNGSGSGSGSDLVDHAYAKQVLMLLVLGGYVKYWEAVAKLEEWFITEAGIDVCDTGKELLQHVFETMEPEPLKTVESNKAD
jgi:hypothetical protein